jgi:hypothetical protein
MRATRGWTTGVAALATLTVLLSGCAGPDSADRGTSSTGYDGRGVDDGQKPKRQVQLIGDGSTAYTGVQPNQPTPHRLEPGQKPPQFVVFSWDGAGEVGNGLFSRFRKLGEQLGASMTYFLSGLYLLPEDQAERYDPPGHAPGASDIGYLSDAHIRATLEQLRLAWLDGSEIGTHFNGHFCGANGVGSWSSEQWKSEIRQARWIVEHWKTTTGWDELDPLPFDYDKELIGGRTPCLEGRDGLLPAARELGFRYDSSGVNRQVWPSKDHGLWDLSMQEVPMPGRSFETVSMDFNFMASQSGGTHGPEALRPAYREQMHDGLMQGFERAYRGNRAPLIIGNHFEEWNGGAYMDAVEEVMRAVCTKDDVRCVSFAQLVNWLEAQDPKVLARLRTLDVGETPEGGWARFLRRG